MLRTRGFLHLTYKLYHHLDKLGERKATCLCVYLAILKYAWKKNNYQCDLRYSTLEKDTKLSRSTVRRCIDTLETMNVIKSIKGRSGKTYVVNAKFLKAETEYMGIKEHPMGIKEHSDGNKRTVLEETIYINTIEDVIRENRGNQQSIIDNLAKLPLSDLQMDKNNPYYIKLAIARKEELAAESKANYVNPNVIIKELTKIKKMSNPRYREKVEYNKRNNLDYKGRPIAKDKD
ncbi:putative transcriptional regulator [Pelagibacter phage HTVC034P]|nr:putative transcriptional regulator [Pelagibacter phage HTVC034P]